MEQQRARIEITDKALEHLEVIRKWTMFLAVVGFAFVGLLILLSIIVLTSASIEGSKLPISGFSLFVVYLTIAALYFFPIYLLFRFSTNTKRAITARSSNYAELAFKNLKAMFVFVGILTIVVLCLVPIVQAFTFLSYWGIDF